LSCNSGKAMPISMCIEIGLDFSIKTCSVTSRRSWKTENVRQYMYRGGIGRLWFLEVPTVRVRTNRVHAYWVRDLVYWYPLEKRPYCCAAVRTWSKLVYSPCILSVLSIPPLPLDLAAIRYC
jgi:hypothetical protein